MLGETDVIHTMEHLPHGVQREGLRKFDTMVRQHKQTTTLEGNMNSITLDVQSYFGHPPCILKQIGGMMERTTCEFAV